MRLDNSHYETFLATIKQSILPKDNILVVGHMICGITDAASGGYSHFFPAPFSYLQVKAYRKGFPRWAGTRQRTPVDD